MSKWQTVGWKSESRTESAEVVATRPMARSVCMLTNAYPDFPESNRVVFMRSLARLLSEKGQRVSVVAPRVFPASRRRECEGDIEVRRFSSFMGGKLLVEYSQTPFIRLSGYMTAGILSAIKCVRERKCDLIHAHWVVPAGLMAFAAARACRVPVVVTAHGSDILVIPKKNRLLQSLVRFALNRADAVTSVAEHLTGEIDRMGVSPKRLLTFPMSVPTDSFRSDGPLPDGWQEEKAVFSNRSLYPLYNVELLVRAGPEILKRVPDARIVIAGEGPESGRLAALSRSLGLSERLNLLGAIPHAQMPQYLRAASVYVSTALSDGASVSLLEAMACGAFPVVADIATNREWIKDGENGLLFAPGDAKALAEKVGDSFARPKLRDRARNFNAELIRQKAQWNSNIDKLLELYDRVTPSR